jgi:hypothetical protein
MRNISNKLVALITLGSWVLILVISLINGFLYGSPPVDSILPPLIAALIGWFAFIMTIFAVIKLYVAGDRGGMDSGRML